MENRKSGTQRAFSITEPCGPLVSTMIIAVLGTVATSYADDFFWNGDDGVFGDGANWNDPADDLVPGPGDTAIFGSGVFTVDLLQSHTNDRLVVSGGFVTLDLGDAFTYTLESPLDRAPGITIDFASLAVRGGSLSASYVDVGVGPVPEGFLFMSFNPGELPTKLTVEERLRINGSLTAGNGATITSRVGEVGQAFGALGIVTFNGAGTAWTMNGRLTVGDLGHGHLSVTDGAVIESRRGIIARRDGSFGSLGVTGPGSSWTISGPVDVGMRGIGTLGAIDGAVITCEGASTVGLYAGDGSGMLTVGQAGATFTVADGLTPGNLTVGVEGVGILRLLGGGHVVVEGDLTATDNTTSGDHPPIEFQLGTADDFPEPAITVGGEASIGGIRVELEDAFEPAFGGLFRLISTGMGLDPVPTIELPLVSAPLIWTVRQTADDLEIIVSAPGCEAGDEPDCNGNGLDDSCDLRFGASADCNGNGVLDECELADMTAQDCNRNGVLDPCDLADATSDDCDGDGVPDECLYASEPDALLDALGAAGDGFGTSVDLGGDRIVVGGTPGRVLVLSRRGQRWVREATLTPSGADDPAFGDAVAIDGNRIVVGAPTGSPAAPPGAVYVFERCEGTWCQTQRIEAPDRDALSFGGSVDVDGDWLVVGAVRDPRGIGYVFARDGETFSLETSFEVSDTPGSSGGSAATVAIDGDSLGVGWRAITGGSGAIQMARLTADGWDAGTRITPPRDVAFQIQMPFALTGDVVGVPTLGGDDEVLVYRFNSEVWLLDATLPPLDGAIGTGIVADDDRFVVHTVGAGNPLVVYDQNGSTWARTSVLTLPTTEEAIDAAVDGNRVVAGVPGDDTVADDAGAAYVYEITGPDCNTNGIADACDIADGTSDDLDGDGVPDECAESCPWDLTGSGSVGFADLSQLLGEWGFCPSCASDLDGDGSVGFAELVQLLGSWGACP